MIKMSIKSRAETNIDGWITFHFNVTFGFKKCNVKKSVGL